MVASSQLERIVQALDGRREGQEYRCQCPIHGGHHLTVGEHDGTVLIHCHAGAKQQEVIQALIDLDIWERKLETSPTRSDMELVSEYHYRDESGQLVATKRRYQRGANKTFMWWLPNAEAPGLGSLKVADLPLYGSELLATDPGLVWFVEGEKAADSCRQMGLLGICQGAGCEAREFGHGLRVLGTRDVVLWPDNDDAGRGLMQRLRLKLEPVCASVRTLAVDLPLKGDAYDYFSAGGNIEALLAQLAEQRTEPWSEETSTGYLVSLPESGGVVRFRFDDVEQRARHLEADVMVWQEVPGAGRHHFSGRLNLLSVSNCEAFRRQLDNTFPETPKGLWTKLLNQACETMRAADATRDWTVNLADVPDDEAVLYLLPPFILAQGSVIFFGHKGSGKTYFVLYLLGQLIELGKSALFVDYEANPRWIKRRLRWLEIEPNMMQRFHYWPGRGRPLTAMLPALTRLINERDIEVLAIDSALMACGGSPQDEGLVGSFFNALSRLGIPIVIIAHLPKDDTKGEYPFGSIFWANCARATWNVRANREAQENPKHIGLYNRDGNEDILHRPIGYQMAFGPEGVTFTREEVSLDLDSRINLGQAIRAELQSEAQSVKRLAEDLGARPDTVARTLRRMSGMINLGLAGDGSGLWALRTEQGEQ